MLENTIQKLRTIILTCFLFLMSAKGWVEHRFDLNISIEIYILTFTLVFLFRDELSKYLLNCFRKNIFEIDFLIIVFLLLHFVATQEITVVGVSFGFLYIFCSSLSRASEKTCKIFVHSLFISAILCSVGVLIGLIEGIIGNSSVFVTIQPPNYPSPILNIFNSLFMTNWIYQISGFQFSINYTAYVLIGGLASIHFIEINKHFKNFFIGIFIFSLILCQAKIGYLFLTFAGIKLISKSPYKFLVITSFLYLLLTHITINHSDNILEITHYFRTLVYSIGSYDFYISFFTWLKISSIEYLASVNWFFGKYNEFINIILAEPHSFWISLILVAGPMTTILILIKFIKVEKSYREALDKGSPLFFASFYTFIIETIVWDAFDSPVFWIVIIIFPIMVIKNYPIKKII